MRVSLNLSHTFLNAAEARFRAQQHLGELRRAHPGYEFALVEEPTDDNRAMQLFVTTEGLSAEAVQQTVLGFTPGGRLRVCELPEDASSNDLTHVLSDIVLGENLEVENGVLWLRQVPLADEVAEFCYQHATKLLGPLRR
jgi:hypothetical protein